MMQKLEEVYIFLPSEVKSEIDKNNVYLNAKLLDFFIEENNDGDEKLVIYYIETDRRLFEISFYPESKFCFYNSMTKRAISKIENHISELDEDVI